ncbi:MAG: YdcF family protein [Chlorobium sp.]|nr:MAG: YdcF family protein [Chlorobium sp.]
MLLVNKILPIFFMPLGVTLLCLLAGLILRKRLLFLYAALILWVFSMPVVCDGLMRFVEGGTERVRVSAVHKADAIVILSGMIREVNGAPLGEWNDAVDRFEGGIDLFKAGKAPVIVFTRGQMPWDTEAIPEGELLAKRAVLLGVPQRAIRLTDRVANTADEAEAALKLLGRKRIILVTSAFHERRATMVFEHEGFEVVPFRVDYRVSPNSGLTVLRFLPSAEALAQSETALHEIIGWIYYWARGVFAK